MFPRLMGIALWNLAWAFWRDRLDRAGGCDAILRSGPSATAESSLHRLMPDGKLLPLRHLCHAVTFSITMKGELA